MNRFLIPVAFAIGLMFVGWIGVGFVGTSWLALAMTLVIAGVYVLGAWELRQFRAATASLAQALEEGLADIPQPIASLSAWLTQVPASLQNVVRLRIEGERVGLPGPALTPYLVGLLVMLGMLGTFLGMVVTFKGAVFALEGSTDLQAIRSALAAPIKGLGLSFGTSVAGVAASAMLGLISAISRRERLRVARQLDTRIATVFRPFSRAHQREESLKALQMQALALPEVVNQLQAMMTQVAQRNEQLTAQLTGQQAQFHSHVSATYTDLASAVGASLKDSLVASARMASESLQPMVDAAMSKIASESKRQHERVSDTVQAQLTGLGAQMLAGQQAICLTLETTATEVSGRATDQANQAMAGVERLLARSEALISSRIETEASWTHHQGERMDQLAGLWRQELGALRDDEALRGQAAVDRLGALQAALSTQLATLGTALETPMSRLMETAAEAPKAATELITQLRQEISRMTERDNLALNEHADLVERISALLDATDKTSTGQRAAVEALVTSAAAVLDKASHQFADVLGSQADKATDVAAHVSGSAIELASLGESFHLAVKLFNDSSSKMTTSLQRVEAAVSQSMARSDEQLAYYVGQAREVIDLSLTSQKAVVEDLRRLRSQQVTTTAQAEGVL